MNSRYSLPPAHQPPSGPDWRRIFRFALLGTVVMLVWLLYPTARCSWQSYADIPLGDQDDVVDVTQGDRERLTRGQGFWDELTDSVGWCYAETPLTGQEPWKTWLFFGFLSVTVMSWSTDRVIRERRRRRYRELG